MIDWHELSKAERHILDTVADDYYKLWELACGETIHAIDKKRRRVKVYHQEAVPLADLQEAARHLYDLGLIEFARVVGDRRESVDLGDLYSMIDDPNHWSFDGPKELDVMATDAGVSVAESWAEH